jgi:hypothetical protein
VTSQATPTPSSPRDWWVIGGMTITAASAAVSSFSGLQSLAVATGWPEPLSPLLPFTVDAYAMTATRVWLSGSTHSGRARSFARWNAIMAIGLSLLGNAVWHLMAAGVLEVSWPIVVLVGAVPPAVLGLLSHLAVLRGQADVVPAVELRPTDAANEVPPSAPRRTEATQLRPHEDRLQAGDGKPDDQPLARPSSPHGGVTNEDGLLSAARAADAAHQAEHGKPITRDELRKMLRVSTERATVLRRQLKQSASSNRGSLL